MNGCSFVAGTLTNGRKSGLQKLSYKKVGYKKSRVQKMGGK
jgi:hypothetical protein